MTAEELGGASLHCATSGVTDHFARDEAHAMSIARDIFAHLRAPQGEGLGTGLAAGQEGRAGADGASAAWQEPLYPADELR